MELLIEKQFHFLFHLACMVSVEALKKHEKYLSKGCLFERS
jgi:hypothetical protein